MGAAGSGIEMTVSRVDASRIRPLRERRRRQTEAQIVRDSILPRGLAEARGVFVDAELVAYGAIWLRHYPGRVFEYAAATPSAPGAFDPCFAALVEAADALKAEAE